MSFIMFTTRAAIFLSIVSYVVRGHDILPETVFVIVSYYQILRQTMTVYFPQGVAQVSVNNFSTYFQAALMFLKYAYS